MYFLQLKFYFVKFVKLHPNITVASKLHHLQNMLLDRSKLKINENKIIQTVLI